MNEDERWVQRLIENPTDVSLRSVYADWLEQSGETARAAYTRASLQVHEAVSRLASVTPPHDTAWSRAVRGGMVGEPHLAVVEHYHDREGDLSQIWLHLLPESEIDETLRAHIDRALGFLEEFQYIYHGLADDLERSLTPPEPSEGTQRKRKRKANRYETDGLTDEIAASILFVAQNTPLLSPLVPASTEASEAPVENPRIDVRQRVLTFDLSRGIAHELPRAVVLSRVLRINYGSSDE